jgi:GDP-4-dehydro-6-deoxy-D-mannose reductase
MKVLITGFSGFVSKHFLDYLEINAHGAIVAGTDKNAPEFEFNNYQNISVEFHQVDLLNKEEVEEIITQFRPEYLLHLASYSSVANSWIRPVESFNNNVNIFLNLVEQIRISNIKCRILSIGSSEEYGNVTEGEVPLTEDHSLRPVSPYGVARVSQEMVSKVYADGYGLDIIITRSFNHIGPGQKDIFVISSFAKQLVQIMKSGSKSGSIVTGDISIVRDFVDVRDVVRAYFLLMQKGKRGEIYNICSGMGRSLKDIIVEMSNILGIEISTTIDAARVRPDDNKLIVGSYQKINREIGWEPSIRIEESLRDIITFWQERSATP